MPDKKPSEKVKKANFKQYEKQASWTIEKFHKENSKTMGRFAMCFILLLALGANFLGHTLLFFILSLIGIAGRFIISRLFYNAFMNNTEKVRKIESGGYTEYFFDEIRKLPENNNKGVAMALAMAYDFCGDTNNALMELKRVDTSVYAYNPSGAHNYYAILLMAYIISGDLDHVADTFSKGFYFMNTYKDSPMIGTLISLALGMYENFCGHYGVSLNLLESAMRLHTANMRPESRIPDENMTSMICYWKAVNFFAMGDKASAWEMINSCKGFYKTPYYEQLSRKLLDDMAKETDHQRVDNIEELY